MYVGTTPKATTCVPEATHHIASSGAEHVPSGQRQRPGGNTHERTKTQGRRTRGDADILSGGNGHRNGRRLARRHLWGLDNVSANAHRTPPGGGLDHPRRALDALTPCPVRRRQQQKNRPSHWAVPRIYATKVWCGQGRIGVILGVGVHAKPSLSLSFPLTTSALRGVVDRRPGFWVVSSMLWFARLLQLPQQQDQEQPHARQKGVRRGKELQQFTPVSSLTKSLEHCLFFFSLLSMSWFLVCLGHLFPFPAPGAWWWAPDWRRTTLRWMGDHCLWGGGAGCWTRTLLFFTTFLFLTSVRSIAFGLGLLVDHCPVFFLSNFRFALRGLYFRLFFFSFFFFFSV
ncbi:hypothetical protein B0T14DRAFT_2640 [Immersiella caudata]|uniref:Uncharacterized protein n=1 Tax=Immersiella caudata TaxID=314043 RepID=A0AA40CBG3_9PEZI|nr:hypothetical protein B0T14DRAFT_2640 [Immersiella caudata]